MNNNLYIDILKELNDFGVLKLYNISPFMLRHFPRPIYKTAPNIGWDEKQEFEAKNFLGQLKARGHIEYELEGVYEVIYWANIDSDGNIQTAQWFDDVPFNIRLTVEGMSYLNDYNLTQSNLQINEASKRNSKTQNLFTSATIFVAFIGAVMSILSYYKENANSNEIKSLKKRLEVIGKDSQKPLSIQKPAQSSDVVRFPSPPLFK